jgi:hypothetical protein
MGVVQRNTWGKMAGGLGQFFQVSGLEHAYPVRPAASPGPAVSGSSEASGK